MWLECAQQRLMLWMEQWNDVERTFKRKSPVQCYRVLLLDEINVDAMGLWFILKKMSCYTGVSPTPECLWIPVSPCYHFSRCSHHCDICHRGPLILNFQPSKMRAQKVFSLKIVLTPEYLIIMKETDSSFSLS